MSVQAADALMAVFGFRRVTLRSEEESGTTEAQELEVGMTLTDELIAELEAAATDSKLNIYRPLGWAHSVRCGNHMQTDFDFLSLASPDTVLSLLSERAELKRDAERRVPLYEAVERACGELPDGWTINLCMEKGAGWIELYDDCGVHIDGFPTNNERLDYTLNDAIDAAMTP